MAGMELSKNEKNHGLAAVITAHLPTSSWVLSKDRPGGQAAAVRRSSPQGRYMLILSVQYSSSRVFQLVACINEAQIVRPQAEMRQIWTLHRFLA